MALTQSGYWIPSNVNAPYVSPITKMAPQFVGKRPKGSCNLMFGDEKTCRAAPPTMGCSWIHMGEKPTDGYCRSPPGAVSGQYPKQVRYQPEYTLGYSPSAFLSKEECLRRNEDCRWIETKYQTKYSRGLPGSTHPFSKTIPIESKKRAQVDDEIQKIDDSLFDNTNQYKPGKWSKLDDSIKDQVFSSKGLTKFEKAATETCSVLSPAGRPECEEIISTMLKKYCRCLLHQPASDIFQHGVQATNPYGICNSALPHKYSAKLEELERRLNKDKANFTPKISVSELRSLNTRVARAGDCSKTLNFEKIPTTFLYAYAVNRAHTTRGRQFFGEGKIPDVATFLKDRSKWRESLLKAIQGYMQS